MDKLVAWGLASNEEKECSNCGMHKDAAKGCCKDEQKQVKFQGEQKIANIDTLLFPVACDIPFAQVEGYKLLAHSAVAVTYPVSHAPPNKTFIPVYLSNRAFLI
ncbi:MAG TPA: hypothetical protein VMR70_15590 [Flavisolibacter sp.]|nr:hypothetical protein [Flavisolibacter sp.]